MNQYTYEENVLLLVAGSKSTQKRLAKQLSTFLPEHLSILSYCTDEESEPLKGRYFTLFSSQEVYEQFLEQGNRDHIEQYLIGTRTILNTNIDKILTLPRDQKILLVTDSKISAMDSLHNLQEIGFDFLHLIPFYPGCTPPRGIRTAITPGDLNQVPAGIEAVFDIGARLFAPSTVIQLMAHYNILEQQVQDYTETFIKTLMETAARISNVVDETSKVMKTVRTQLAGTGYFAKYHFCDIIGESPGIRRAKDIAKKLSATDLTVLIEGDNGTGKELFASAIHQASDRNKHPFVAINFSALPDNLVESELFGYEEGAFTGARKGGKIGLFQQASGGTIFLDEIGDASLKLQAKLLRVIQEREIMRVGGNRIIPIDVRIIAATNQDLKQMIKAKTFRKDLYYRLKEGWLHIPSLAERKEDIPLLLQHWQSTVFGGSKTISRDVSEMLMRHDWPGNIRELLNTMKYAFAVCSSDTIFPDDLPIEEFSSFPRTAPEDQSSADCSDTGIRILDAIREITRQSGIPGRTAICRLLAGQGITVSEYRVRCEIQSLIKEDLVRSLPGRYGVFLTEKGTDLLSSRELHPKI